MKPSKQTVTLKINYKYIQVSTTVKVNLLVTTFFIAKFEDQIIALKDDFDVTRFGENHVDTNLLPSGAIVLIICSEVVSF